MSNNHSEKIKVFAFPYAGAFEFSYNQIKDSFGKQVEFKALGLAGRGKRQGEQLMKNTSDISDDLYNLIKNELHKPYILFGHSFGALLGYLVLKKIKSENKPMPLQVFFTGAKSPSKRLETTGRYLLGKEAFNKEIRSLGGSSEEVLRNTELMNYLEPILRADLEALETYVYKQDDPIDFPLFVAAGTDEEFTKDELAAWTDITVGSFETKRYEGSHFFIFESKEKVMKDIREKIKVLVNG